MDGSVDFNRSWQTYEEGFGQADGEYWLGKKYKQHIAYSQFQYGIFMMHRYLFLKYFVLGCNLSLITIQFNNTKIGSKY